MYKKKVLEIACFNLGSALIAQSSGADRIEFCSNYWEGGITPLERHIAEVRERITIPLHIMIRCRGGDYNYTSEELIEMRRSVEFCKKIKANGIVLGVLDEQDNVDEEACRMLMDVAGEMEVVFH